jgi:hypothetical protein
MEDANDKVLAVKKGDEYRMSASVFLNIVFILPLIVFS